MAGAQSRRNDFKRQIRQPNLFFFSCFYINDQIVSTYLASISFNLKRFQNSSKHKYIQNQYWKKEQVWIMKTTHQWSERCLYFAKKMYHKKMILWHPFHNLVSSVSSWKSMEVICKIIYFVELKPIAEWLKRAKISH